MRSVTSDHAGEAQQRAPALVVAHGFTGSSRTPPVRRITERLHRHGFAVLAIDFRGHGRSGGSAPPAVSRCTTSPRRSRSCVDAATPG